MNDPIITRALAFAKQRNMSQSDLARGLGLPPQHITNWKARGVPAEKYVAIADLLECSLDDLLGRRRYLPIDPFIPWPFAGVSESKLRALPIDQVPRLEGAILLAAAQLGIDLQNNQTNPIDHQEQKHG